MAEEIEVAVVSQPSVDVLTAEVQVSVAVDTRSLEATTIESPTVAVVSDSEFTVVSVGEQGPAGSGSGSGSTTATYTAGEAIGGGRVIVTDASGLAVYADNTNPAHANMATKITTGAAALGDTVTANLSGQMTDASWSWTPQGSIYVGASGLMTQTAPTSPAAFAKVVAVAETATRILIVQEPPVMLA